MPHRMAGVDLLGEPEGVDGRAPFLQMTVDVEAADNDSEIDVVGADVVDAVADVNVDGVADHDKHHAVTNEELHGRISGPNRLRKKNGRRSPMERLSKQNPALPSDLRPAAHAKFGCSRHSQTNQ